MGKTAALLAVVLAISLAGRESSAGKLADLIPGLYGGNGIRLITVIGPASFPHRPDDDPISKITQFSEHIASEIGLFPFSSSVSGFTFAFDEDVGTFVRTDEPLGPLFGEKAPTLGRGRLTLNFFSFTNFRYDKFDGERLGSLRREARIDANLIPPNHRRDFFELDAILLDFDLDLRIQLFGMAATYGITDRLEAGLLIPIARVDMDIKSRARIRVSPKNPFPQASSLGESPEDVARGKATGLGDLVVRVKYHLLQSEVVDIAGVLLARMETGDEKDFLGTGSSTLRPLLIFSRTFFGVVRPHLNLGYELNLDRHDKNSLRYALGFDAGTQRFTVAGDVLGSHELDGDGVGDNIVTGSLGVKWNPWRKLLLSGNVQFPLNREGLRSNWIATFGLEYAF